MLIDMELKDYLPALLSFIVGLLGIFIQLYIIKKNDKKEIKRLSYENMQNVYLPLLSLLKEYEIYRSILLKKVSDFNVLEKPMNNENNIQYIYLELIKVYKEIKKVLRCKFIPIDKDINIEIFRLLDHVNRVIISIDSPKHNLRDSVLKNEEKMGLDVSNLIRKVEDLLLDESERN